MARASAPMTKPVFSFVPGIPILASDLGNVHAAQSWAKIKRFQTLLNFADDGVMHPTVIQDTTALTFNQVLRAYVYIEDDYLTLVGYAIAATAQIRARLLIGGSPFVDVDSSVEAGTGLHVSQYGLSTATTGTGWQFVSLSVASVAGGDPGFRGFVLRAVPLSNPDLGNPQ